MKTHPPVDFNQLADSYDKRNLRMQAFQQALHLCLRGIFMTRPAQARVLCVGAGTGQELLFLANHFPDWQFCLVEPAEAMLAICRAKADAAGISERCEFFTGYLDELPASRPFDVATSILVSQFITDESERVDFFREIAGRLTPEGVLVSADLSADMNSTSFQELFPAWATLQEMPAEKSEMLQQQWSRMLAIVPPQEVAAIIAKGGF